MCKRVYACLFRIFQKPTESISHLKSRTLVTATNFQSNVVESFPFCRNYCNINYSKDIGDNRRIYNDVNIEEITNGDPELTKKLTALMLEIENCHSRGKFLPKKITVSKWKYLLTELSTPTSRKKYLTHLAVTELKNESREAKKTQKNSNFNKKKELVNLPDHINYSIGHNALFMRIRPDSVSNLLQTKCHSALLYSNNIIFDLSYEKYMTLNEIHDCVQQVFRSATLNRDHISPLCLHFCNVPTEGKFKDCMEKIFGSCKLFETVQFYKENYLEVFDPNNLVYLSPHAEEELLEYNPDDVYIIGAYVDKSTSLPVSFEKAKAEKIRSAKLPIDKYIKWKQGKKLLSLNVVYGILLDLNYYRDMKKALFKNLPTKCYYKKLDKKSELRLDQEKQSSISM